MDQTFCFVWKSCFFPSDFVLYPIRISLWFLYSYDLFLLYPMRVPPLDYRVHREHYWRVVGFVYTVQTQTVFFHPEFVMTRDFFPLEKKITINVRYRFFLCTVWWARYVGQRYTRVLNVSTTHLECKTNKTTRKVCFTYRLCSARCAFLSVFGRTSVARSRTWTFTDLVYA